MRESMVIGVNVFRQLLRNRILVVLALFAAALVAVALFLGELGQETETRLSKDFGLLAVEAIGFFTVLLCHVVLLFEETELRTIAILFVKPIARWQYMLGKLVGSLLLLAMNQAVMIAVLAAMARWRGIEVIDFPFLVSAAYLYLGGALFSFVTVFFSIFASNVPSCAVYSTFAFCLGHFTTNLLEWAQKLEKPLLIAGVKAVYFVVPNFSLFNLKDNLDAIKFFSLAEPGGLAPYLWPLAYLACYGGGLLLWTVRLYERKEY